MCTNVMRVIGRIIYTGCSIIIEQILNNKIFKLGISFFFHEQKTYLNV